MKLIQIYRRYSLYTLLIVLTIGSISHYYIFRYCIYDATDDLLVEYRHALEEYAEKNDTIIPYREFDTEYNKLLSYKTNKCLTKERAIYDSLIYSKYQEEQIAYRVLKFNLHTSKDNYMITLMLPTLEEDNLMSAVLVSLVILLLLFILFSFFINQYYTLVLWKPFYKILNRVKRFDVEKKVSSQPAICHVDEFDELDAAINRMMNKINSDYSALKEFTENTSHELQTPLAIIKGKLEILQQSELQNEKNIKAIQAIHGAVNRLTSFNRSLLMLTKINNDQYPEKHKINFNHIWEEQLEYYEDIITAKGISTEKKLTGLFKWEMHKMLADVLVSNALTNAIRYNTANGYIKIQIDKHGMVISNTYGNVIPENDLFGRFVKSKQDKDSTGLGLTIAKIICHKNNLDISYSITEKEFILSILNDLC